MSYFTFFHFTLCPQKSSVCFILTAVWTCQITNAQKPVWLVAATCRTSHLELHTEGKVHDIKKKISSQRRK